MLRFDFRISGDADHGLMVYPLSARALDMVETARQLRYPAAYQWYATDEEELGRLHGHGFTFC